MVKWSELVFWNSNSYGSAVKVRRSLLIGLLVFFCLVTPGTNWLIPFSKRIVRKDLVWRF